MSASGVHSFSLLPCSGSCCVLSRWAVSCLIHTPQHIHSPLDHLLPLHPEPQTGDHILCLIHASHCSQPTCLLLVFVEVAHRRIKALTLTWHHYFSELPKYCTLNPVKSPRTEFNTRGQTSRDILWHSAVILLALISKKRWWKSTLGKVLKLVLRESVGYLDFRKNRFPNGACIKAVMHLSVLCLTLTPGSIWLQSFYSFVLVGGYN